MKGQTVHLPKQAWRLGLFFIGILLAGGVLLMYIPAWACPMKRSPCWSPSSVPSCSRSCLGITSSKKRRWPSSTWIIPSTAMNSSRKWMRRPYRHQHGLSQCCQPQGLILLRPFCCRRLFPQGLGKEPLQRCSRPDRRLL